MEALVISLTAALGFVAFGLGVFVLAKPPSSPPTATRSEKRPRRAVLETVTF